jgi:hypothetical protein
VDQLLTKRIGFGFAALNHPTMNGTPSFRIFDPTDGRAAAPSARPDAPTGHAAEKAVLVIARSGEKSAPDAEGRGTSGAVMAIEGFR